MTWEWWAELVHAYGPTAAKLAAVAFVVWFVLQLMGGDDD